MTALDEARQLLTADGINVDACSPWDLLVHIEKRRSTNDATAKDEELEDLLLEALDELHQEYGNPSYRSEVATDLAAALGALIHMHSPYATKYEGKLERILAQGREAIGAHVVEQERIYG